MPDFTHSARITPFLWFNTEAEPAADFYVAIFPNSRKIAVQRNPSASDVPGYSPPTDVLTVTFELDGLQFTALNGGPSFKFTEAVSFVVRCDSQQEIDHYWERLTAAGGQEIQCGWLRDKFGLCWQVVPARIGELIRHPKAFQAMMSMKKLDIAALERAGRDS